MGPALAQMLADCLARSVLHSWAAARGDKGAPCEASERVAKREAARAIGAAAAEWVGAGMPRMVAGWTLCEALGGRSPWHCDL